MIQASNRHFANPDPKEQARIERSMQEQSAKAFTDQVQRHKKKKQKRGFGRFLDALLCRGRG